MKRRFKIWLVLMDASLASLLEELLPWVAACMIGGVLFWLYGLAVLRIGA